MPIFEYSCNDCGTRFEKLVRGSSSADAVHCPRCGQDHVQTEYSTFAAHSRSGPSATECCSPAPSGGCGGGMCQGGMCGMNFN